jgi:hypothetical protein
MTYKTKIAGAIATGALLATALLPTSAFADQTCRISGNGSNSTNRCRIKVERRIRVDQSNTATVVNTVVVTQNTGGNNANNNTGGNVHNETGNNTSTITITVSGNTNTAVPPSP